MTPALMQIYSAGSIPSLTVCHNVYHNDHIVYHNVYHNDHTVYHNVYHNHHILLSQGI